MTRKMSKRKKLVIKLVIMKDLVRSIANRRSRNKRKEVLQLEKELEASEEITQEIEC